MISFAIARCCAAASKIDSFPLLSSPTHASNQVQLTLTGERNVSYLIEVLANAVMAETRDASSLCL